MHVLKQPVQRDATFSQRIRCSPLVDKNKHSKPQIICRLHCSVIRSIKVTTKFQDEVLRYHFVSPKLKIIQSNIK